MERNLAVLRKNKNDSLMKNKLLGALFGLCIGDALGVPAEFMTRDELDKNKVTCMRGYGTYNQPPGTWSDDSSLTFCLTESLCNGISYDGISKRFCKWLYEGYWTPYGVAFDVGGTTEKAIENMRRGVLPIECGGASERSNGNGSLMRVLPLAFYVLNMDSERKFQIIHDVSSLTHGHTRSKIACSIYVQMAIELIKGSEPKVAYNNMKKIILSYYSKEEYRKELRFFDRILKEDISKEFRRDINSTGYVIDTIEASLWCLFKSESYKETVLRAVNLGDDTDTTAAVAGGLAGIYYGFEGIPKLWIQKIARKEDIIELVNKYNKALMKKQVMI